MDEAKTAAQETMTVTRKIARPGIDESRIEKLKRVAEERSEYGPFAIFIAQIDPDAIGSAFGMQEVLTQLGHSSHIYYQGRVGHPQNEALCQKLGLMSRMRPIMETEEAQSGEPPKNIILVDSSRSKDSRLPFMVDPVIVVDHHEKSDIKDRGDIFL